MTTKCNAWSYTEFWIGVKLMYQMVLEQLVKSKYGLWVIQPYQIKLTFLSFELFIVIEESVLVFGKCVMKGFRVKRQRSATHCP